MSLLIAEASTDRLASFLPSIVSKYYAIITYLRVVYRVVRQGGQRGVEAVGIESVEG